MRECARNVTANITRRVHVQILTPTNRGATTHAQTIAVFSLPRTAWERGYTQHALENLHIHELNSMAILYTEDGLSFHGERWSYHLGKHTTEEDKYIHTNEGLYPKRTLLLV